MHLQMQIEIEVFSPSCVLLHFYCVVIRITYKYNRLGCVFLAVSAVIRNGFACCFFFFSPPHLWELRSVRMLWVTAICFSLLFRFENALDSGISLN